MALAYLCLSIVETFHAHLQTRQKRNGSHTVSQCPVTIPNGQTLPGERPSAGHHGNGWLWTGLSTDGITQARRDRQQVLDDGTIEMKFPWWGRVTGHLELTGTRRGDPTAQLRARLSDGGRQPGFVASTLIFSGAGCWEVVAKAGGKVLSFVTLVE